jgi:hypothetical protein
MMSTAHGAGLMLVPALIPMCLGDASTRQIGASNSLLPALAAIGVHSAAMLVVTGGMATGVCRGLGAMRRPASPVAPAIVFNSAGRHSRSGTLR